MLLFQNLDYVIVSGARRQENRWDPLQNEQVVPETKEVSRKLFDDAMYKLEHGEDDKNTAKSRKSALEGVIALNESRWKDDYSANCALRATFRVCTLRLFPTFKENLEFDVIYFYDFYRQGRKSFRRNGPWTNLCWIKWDLTLN